jgi:transposase InsO family protein
MAMETEMTAQLVTDALIMAVWRRGKLNLLSIKPAADQERKVGPQRKQATI